MRTAGLDFCRRCTAAAATARTGMNVRRLMRVFFETAWPEVHAYARCPIFSLLCACVCVSVCVPASPSVRSRDENGAPGQCGDRATKVHAPRLHPGCRVSAEPQTHGVRKTVNMNHETTERVQEFLLALVETEPVFWRPSVRRTTEIPEDTRRVSPDLPKFPQPTTTA